MARTKQLEALEVFLGKWTATGSSYGRNDQSAKRPKANAANWFSTHDAYWHTGKFFMVQDEKAIVGGSRFDTLSVMGIDDDGKYFARTFENHGFYRHYVMKRSGKTWTMTGKTERARIEFSDKGRTQRITWEWLHDGEWLPLCDRTATRED